MRPRALYPIAMATLLTVAMVAPVAAQPAPIDQGRAAITVRVDGHTITFPDQQPVNRDGRVLVPIRSMVMAMDRQATVEWHPETKSAYITAHDAEGTGHQVQVQIGSTHAWADTWQYQLDVAPAVINNRTLMPARFVAEALGAAVTWDQSTQTVNICTTCQPAITPAEIRAAVTLISPWVKAVEGRPIAGKPAQFLPLRPAVVNQIRTGVARWTPMVCYVPRPAPAPDWPANQQHWWGVTVAIDIPSAKEALENSQNALDWEQALVDGAQGWYWLQTFHQELVEPLTQGAAVGVAAQDLMLLGFEDCISAATRGVRVDLVNLRLGYMYGGCSSF